MEHNRVAEIANMHTAPSIKVGSGYLIKDNLILTARHVLTYPQSKNSVSVGSKYSFRLIGDFERGKDHEWDHTAVLCWESSDFDIALLKVKRQLNSLRSSSSKPTMFGTLGLDTCLAEGVGFPKFQKVEDKQNAEPIVGKLSILAGQKTDQVRLSVTSKTPPEGPKGWLGISGTALFVEDYLVAVITVTNQGNTENDDGEQENNVRGLGQEALWASPISLLSDNKEFCKLVFGHRNKCVLQSLPTPRKHQISENDPINDVDIQEIYPPPISVDDFIKLLSNYGSSYNDEQLKLSILDNIALYAWNLIVERSSEPEIATAVRIHIEENNDLSKLITPLYILAEKGDITASELASFFEVGILNGEFIPADVPLEGYIILLRRLIISLLYSHPHLITDLSISKWIEELLSRRTLFWVEFFADVFLRWKCGNIEIPNTQLLLAIENSTNRYITAYPEKPIVILWPVITLPLETASLQKEDVLSLIRESARSCRRNIEFKWCISAATRILPLYDNYEDERTDQNFINSLFEQEFDKKLALRSPQIQSIYLRGILKNFLRTKDIEHLSNYETQFLHTCKNLPHPSRCHLQIEYVSCLYLYFQMLSKERQQDEFRQLRVGALIESERDLLKDPLFDNHLLKYKKETFYSDRRKKKLSISDHKSIVSFLNSYIMAMYAQYAQRLIELNHLYVRDFPALSQIYHIRKDIATLILASLQKSIHSDPSYHYSFYARSTPMLSGIERRSHLDLIQSYVFKALKSDTYSIIRNAKDIIWGLYSCNYYAEEKFSDDIQKASVEFAIIDGILTKDGNVNLEGLPKVHWAYYAGIRWYKSADEKNFISDLYRTPVSGKVFQLNVRSDKDIGVKFPDEIFNVIRKHSKKSVFAATLSMNFDSADVWNILGTTVYNHSNSTSKTSAAELRKAARFYSMAKCFSRMSKDHAQKYCYNYIRCNSLAINETGFDDRHNFFVSDTARYLIYPNNRAKMFGYKLDCLEPYLEMIQSNWGHLSKRTRKDVFCLLRVEWLEPEFYKPKYESLLSSFRQVSK